MPDRRPDIPAETRRLVLMESGHRCAVCGDTCPLERAHIVPWSSTRDHSLENLICLCASCHQRADSEQWGEKVLQAYKSKPWVLRRFVPKDDDVGAVGRRDELLAFKNMFMLHAPPSETDATLGYGNPEIDVRDIASAFCDIAAQKFDLFFPVYRSHSHLLPAESESLFNKMAERVKFGRMQWANKLRSTNILVVGRDFTTAGLEFHFHRLVLEAIEIELRRVMGDEPSGLTLALHSIALKDGAGVSSTS